MKPNTFGAHGWKFEEENIERLKDGVLSIGTGKHLVAQTGIDHESLARLVAPIVREMIDDGANILEVSMPTGGKFFAYCRRRGAAVDFGAREDFEELGWGELCDELDLQRKQAK